jgi:folate-binding Fe-S cluster repair protein YgfZ
LQEKKKIQNAGLKKLSKYTFFFKKTMAADDSGTTVDRPTYRKNYNYLQPARAHS